MESKIKISQKEIDDIYEIDSEITGETKETAKPQDTTPEFLTEEEEKFDEALFETHPLPEEELEND